jgi:hypothetical protein
MREVAFSEDIAVSRVIPMRVMQPVGGVEMLFTENRYASVHRRYCPAATDV